MKLAKVFGKKKNMVIGGLILLGAVVLLAILVNYNKEKSLLNDSMSNNPFLGATDIEHTVPKNDENNSVVKPVNTIPDTSFLKVKDIKSSSNLENKGNCNNNTVMDPKELLPSESSSVDNEFLESAQNKDITSTNMLNAGHHIGINTVGSSLRNANLQLRSEPQIPQVNIGPWNNTTIESDKYRRPLEIIDSA